MVLMMAAMWVERSVEKRAASLVGLLVDQMVACLVVRRVEQ